MGNELARTLRSLGVVFLMGASVCPAVRADTPGDAFAQLVAQLQGHPDDKALRERVVQAARDQAAPPAIPEAARRFYIRGRTALEDAHGPEGYQRAIHNYEEALKIAPWWGDAYGNLAKARDLAGDYSGAIRALELYLLSGPAQADARQAQDRIYVLEEKRDAALDPPHDQGRDDGRSDSRGRNEAPVQQQDRRAPAVALSGPVKQENRAGVELSDNSSPPGTVFKDCPQCPELVVVNRKTAVGKYLVTQKQWRDLMGSNPSFFQKCGDDCPVENVSWNDTQEFLARLNDRTGKDYALPTEAQWEYACQAGGHADFCGAAQFEPVAWYLKNSSARTHPVGQKQPNALGLYDMSGNVWEWTSECSKDDCRSRVLRGGSWTFDPQFARAHKRIVIEASLRSNDYGLRVVRSLN